jgi:hypothetical protein
MERDGAETSLDDGEREEERRGREGSRSSDRKKPTRRANHAPAKSGQQSSKTAVHTSGPENLE